MAVIYNRWHLLIAQCVDSERTRVGPWAEDMLMGCLALPDTLLLSEQH